MSSPQSHVFSPSVRELLTSPSKNLTSDAIVKLIVIGPSSVGKSCLIYTFTEGEFLAQHDVTVGVEFAIRIVDIAGKKVKLQIWDTAGQESFRSVTSNYYRGSLGALLVYDVTKRDTFAYLEGWLKELRFHADPVVVVVGNKSDIAQRPGERQVNTEEGQEFATKHGLQFVELTAKHPKEVERAFMIVAEKAFEALQASQTPPPLDLSASSSSTSAPPASSEENTKSGCCS